MDGGKSVTHNKQNIPVKTIGSRQNISAKTNNSHQNIHARTDDSQPNIFARTDGSQTIRATDSLHREKNANSAAILAKVESDIQIGEENYSDYNNRIFFQIGISNNKTFRVSDEGSAFQFVVPGLYRIQFDADITHKGKLFFMRKPHFNSNQENFNNYEFGGGKMTQSTMLPFRSGSTLCVKFFPHNKNSNTIVKSGAQIEIYLVDDL